VVVVVMVVVLVVAVVALIPIRVWPVFTPWAVIRLTGAPVVIRHADLFTYGNGVKRVRIAFW
jgi:hypothetical protein